jgi:putative nucleotidyltransferase with HDIG domain
LSGKAKKAQVASAPRSWFPRWPQPANAPRAWRRLLVALGAGAVLSTLLTIQLLPDKVSLRIGQTAPEDIVAHKYAQYEDTAETRRIRAAAAQNVPKQYAVDQNAAHQTEEELLRLFAALHRTQNAHGPSAAARPAQRAAPAVRLAEALKSDTGHSYPADQLEAALHIDPALLTRLEPEALGLVRLCMGRPVSDDTDDLPRARRALAASLVGPDAAGEPSVRAARQVLAALLPVALRPNRIFDQRSTQAEMRREAEAVQPIYRTISRGEVIIRRGDRVTEEHIDRFRALDLQRPHIDFPTAFSLCLICFGLVGLTALYLYHFHRRIYQGLSSLVLLAVTTCSAVLLMRLTWTLLGLKLSGTQLGYTGMICSATAAMLIAVLLNPSVAFFVAALLAVLTGVMVNNELRFTILAMVSAFVGIHVVADIRDRAGLLRAALALSVVNAATCLLVLGISSGDFLADAATGLAWGVIGGIASAFLFALGAALLERPFGVTTHLTLLELSDPNKPLLKRLAMEAPGTYAHSIIVGNLAEAAAEAIGADALFARVASYYHDIGKMVRPQFFVENQQRGNVHDRMTPSLSRLVVTSHVKDGVELADEHHLPAPIIDVIKEHHGTCLIKYFYHQATQSGAEEPGPALEYQFRYEGPRPRTKESGIIMVADAAEAASRTLEKPTPGRLRELVERIVRDRLADGQLDDCELTFKDLEKIIGSITRSLTGMLHGRIDYPDAPDLRRQASAVSPQPSESPDLAPRAGVAAAEPWVALTGNDGTTDKDRMVAGPAGATAAALSEAHGEPRGRAAAS